MNKILIIIARIGLVATNSIETRNTVNINLKTIKNALADPNRERVIVYDPLRPGEEMSGEWWSGSQMVVRYIPKSVT